MRYEAELLSVLSHFERRVRRYALSYPYLDLDEIVNECVVRFVAEWARKYDPSLGSPLGFANSAALYTFLNVRRMVQHRLFPIPLERDPPWDLAEALTVKRLLSKLHKQLSPKERLVLAELLAGFKYPAIAQKLEMSKGEVRYCIYRIRCYAENLQSPKPLPPKRLRRRMRELSSWKARPCTARGWD